MIVLSKFLQYRNKMRYVDNWIASYHLGREMGGLIDKNFRRILLLYRF